MTTMRIIRSTTIGMTGRTRQGATILRVTGSSSSPSQDFLTSIDDLRSLVRDETPEGLHLEYKRKADPSTPVLSKDERRAIAEAVSAFANSDGGTLVLGVGSETRNHADIAVEIVPIAGIDQLHGEVRKIVELNVSPQVRGVSVDVIRVEESSQSGALVVRVPASDGRPHMSIATGVHRYYRRDFTGSRIMTPNEIRDQILAVREARLQPIVTAGGGGFSKHPDFVAITASIYVKLRNVGSRLCREPFMRVSADCQLHAHSINYDGRLEAWKTEYPPGMIVHVDDETPTLSLKYLMRLDIEPFRHPDQLTEEALLAAASVLPHGNQHSGEAYQGESLTSIGLNVTHGAENATARTENFVLTREELAISVLAGSSDTLRNMLLDEVGVWRQDVFTALADRSSPASGAA